MGIFGDLPPPNKSRATASGEGSELGARLSCLKKKAFNEEDAEVSEQASEEEEEEESETGGQESETLMSDLRRRPRPRDDEGEDDEPVVEENCQPSSHAESDAPQPASKRVRIHEEVVTATIPSSSTKLTEDEDQVKAALRRISSHIGNPSKFPKACPLLRKLLDGQAVSKSSHQIDVFEAIRSAFHDPLNCAEPTLRREYMKLIAAVASRPDLFGKVERAHLDVYRIIGHVQNEMGTDDNFQFNKALSHIREAIDELPECMQEDEVIHQRLCQNGNAWTSSGSAHAEAHHHAELRHKQLKEEYAAAMHKWQQEQQRLDEEEELAQQQQQEKQEHQDMFVGSKEELVEADPFGLDSLLAEPVKPAAAAPRRRRPAPVPPPDLPPAPPSSSAWDAGEVCCMKREAVLACLHTAKGFHRHPWAKTGIELLVEHIHKNKDRFCLSQQRAIDEFMVWVRQQRALRKKGPTAKEINRDSTSFDRARAEWSKDTSISHRGKVGGGGDSKANNWLG
ncbi:hypothetical protein CEUSTIGMA_g10885.t1 [Chlamydomonas eustigma]|uniref:Uncharacterized protein n=1 Tax=Chlamydomonas eustigma TaxID=1157962 RepID=A0A250XKZ5_9CHLO|nr:hypothetical protein CEUSTIGMA_g10885.t1 [Chlamydomonas eustigma]|eukprot:GAX83460.1 hypothetical protein CEUSTIGMA_g10885.t1 [Chlamydomonas eustigma]